MNKYINNALGILLIIAGVWMLVSLYKCTRPKPNVNQEIESMAKAKQDTVSKSIKKQEVIVDSIKTVQDKTFKKGEAIKAKDKSTMDLSKLIPKRSQLTRNKSIVVIGDKVIQDTSHYDSTANRAIETQAIKDSSLAINSNLEATILAERLANARKDSAATKSDSLQAEEIKQINKNTKKELRRATWKGYKAGIISIAIIGGVIAILSALGI